MKRFPVFLLILMIGSVVAGLYGILHDQLTYTISPEYYTKFKFIQFGLADPSTTEAVFSKPRFSVATVGFRATWWMGLLIGLVLAWTGRVHKDPKKMFKHTVTALFITLIVAFATGLVGLAYGKYHLAKTGVDWWLPEHLKDIENFIAVGSMHNFSYFGGLAGMCAGILYSLSKRELNVKS